MDRYTPPSRLSARLIRTAPAAVIAIVLASALALPVGAAQPTRTVIYQPDHDLTADQSGCGFAVHIAVAPGGYYRVSNYADGRQVTEEHEVRTITNPLTGRSFVQHADWHDVEWFDPTTGLIHGITNGRQAAGFYPGDIGPDGQIVQAPGLGLEFVGTQWYTYDLNVFRLTEFAYAGKPITDICAALS